MDKIVDKCQIIPFILWSDVNYENWRNALYFDIISDTRVVGAPPRSLRPPGKNTYFL